MSALQKKLQQQQAAQFAVSTNSAFKARKLKSETEDIDRDKYRETDRDKGEDIQIHSRPISDKNSMNETLAQTITIADKVEEINSTSCRDKVDDEEGRLTTTTTAPTTPTGGTTSSDTGDTIMIAGAMDIHNKRRRISIQDQGLTCNTTATTLSNINAMTISMSASTTSTTRTSSSGPSSPLLQAIKRQRDVSDDMNNHVVRMLIDDDIDRNPTKQHSLPPPIAIPSSLSLPLPSVMSSQSSSLSTVFPCLSPILPTSSSSTLSLSLAMSLSPQPTLTPLESYDLSPTPQLIDTDTGQLTYNTRLQSDNIITETTASSNTDHGK